MTTSPPTQSDTIPFPLLLILPKEIPPTILALTTQQIATLLQITDSTLRGWVSRQQFPRKDGDINGKTPYWRLTTLLDYLRCAPGGLLPYAVP